MILELKVLMSLYQCCKILDGCECSGWISWGGGSASPAQVTSSQGSQYLSLLLCTSSCTQSSQVPHLGEPVGEPDYTQWHKQPLWSGKFWSATSSWSNTGYSPKQWQTPQKALSNQCTTTCSTLVHKATFFIRCLILNPRQLCRADNWGIFGVGSPQNFTILKRDQPWFAFASTSKEPFSPQPPFWDPPCHRPYLWQVHFQPI